MSVELTAIGLPVDPSYGNFILVNFADEAAAKSADAALRGAGIIVRHVASYGLPQCLRITVGDELACRQVVSVLTEWVSDQ